MSVPSVAVLWRTWCTILTTASGGPAWQTQQTEEDKAKSWTVPVLFGTAASNGQPRLQLMQDRTATIEVRYDTTLMLLPL
jgi:hypothetical protein